MLENWIFFESGNDGKWLVSDFYRNIEKIEKLKIVELFILFSKNLRLVV
jgi:hypothetical protein